MRLAIRRIVAASGETLVSVDFYLLAVTARVHGWRDDMAAERLQVNRGFP
jgi:hypothetical protein